MSSRVELRRGQYHDSVALMRVSRDISDLPGIQTALVAMATELNLAVMADMGFDHAAAALAAPDDLIIAVHAADEDALAAAWETVASALAPPPTRSTDAFALPEPRTIEAAADVARANIAVISVPGQHAFVEAMAALHAGLHVMVFSDNVPVDQEVALKAFATPRDLLVMGPDCGTSIIGGVGLGFANVVRPGPVSITGASGTGIQQLCCLFDDGDIGIRHALGTGSRDLSSPVGGSSTLQAIHALDADPATDVIVVVSKPPAPDVADRVRAAAAACSTPTVVAFLGEGSVTLQSAAEETASLLGAPALSPASWPAQPRPSARPGALVGLFSGGTLRDEARSIATSTLGEIDVASAASGHRFIDLGGDEFTRGRPHPMIDQRLKSEHLAEAAADPATAAILLDVVLGHGAHPDPAGELAAIISAAAGRGVPIVVSLCGSRADPQNRDAQAQRLHDAGASVWLSNAAAAHEAATLVGGASQ